MEWITDTDRHARNRTFNASIRIFQRKSYFNILDLSGADENLTSFLVFPLMSWDHNVELYLEYKVNCISNHRSHTCHVILTVSCHFLIFRILFPIHLCSVLQATPWKKPNEKSHFFFLALFGIMHHKSMWCQKQTGSEQHIILYIMQRH